MSFYKEGKGGIEATYNDGYETQEDLEQLVKFSLKSTKKDNESVKENLSIISYNHQDKNPSDNNDWNLKKKSNQSTLNMLRFLNCSSIIILLTSYFTTSITHINNEEYNLIMEYLRRDKIQAESNLMVLYIAFFFVALSLILAFLRNAIFIKETDFSHIDVKTVITQHYKHYYYLGNILFSLCLISNHTKIMEKYGLNCVLCFITLFVYCKAYYCHNSRKNNVKLDSIFNFISFSVNISFLLAWNASYITLTLASFLSFFKINISTLMGINLFFQVLLSSFLILSISYFQDIYFSFIILIFQVGNTLNKNIFNLNMSSDTNDIKDKNNISLIITLFSTVCFLWSIYYIPRLKNSKYSEDMEELNKNYLRDKNKNEVI